MAEKIKKEVGVTARLIEGGGGIFDVIVDGKKVFSKHDVGRFPEHDEIIRHLKKPVG